VGIIYRLKGTSAHYKMLLQRIKNGGETNVCKKIKKADRLYESGRLWHIKTVLCLYIFMSALCPFAGA
jgi:hypothetical protein